MPHSRIVGTGSYLPEKIVSNKDLEATIDTSDEWIRERTGIRCRHIAADDEKTSDMAVIAARRAIEAAGIDVQEIDLIVMATTTPDKIFPSTACIVQRKLGIEGGAAFDVQAVCSGFVYGLDIAHRFIKTGGAKTVLVIGAETMSRIVDWQDRSTAVLFGDGAGAVILQASEEEGIVSTHIHSDGSLEETLHVPYGVSQGYDAVCDGRAFIAKLSACSAPSLVRRSTAITSTRKTSTGLCHTRRICALSQRRRRNSVCRWSAWL